MRIWPAWLVLAVGCGRWDFNPVATGDAARDTPPGIPDSLVDGAAVCPVGALICDDFETGDTSKWSFVHTNGTGSINVTSNRVRSGMRSLEIVIPSAAANDYARDLVLRVPPVSTGTIAMRAWVNLASTMADFNLIIVLRHMSTPQYLTAGGNTLGNWISSDNSASNALADHDSTTPTPALATWFCVELIFDFATTPGPGRTRILVDGATVVDAMTNDSAPAYTDLSIGIPKADNMGFSAFFDDVIIATQPIGCQ